MTRFALIIAVPGTSTDHLPGVELDWQNYQNFLCSPTGGGWYPHEVQVLYNPTQTEVVEYLGLMQTDFTLVIFSGHGSMTHDNYFVELHPAGERLGVAHLHTAAWAQLVILDACRTPVASLAGEVTQDLHTFPSELTMAQARQRYEEQINRCIPGTVVCYSCQPYRKAYDSSSSGCFSNALFSVANDWALRPGQAIALPIDDACHYADLQMPLQNQQHSYVFSTPENRKQWFPLAVRPTRHLL